MDNTSQVMSHQLQVGDKVELYRISDRVFTAIYVMGQKDICLVEIDDYGNYGDIIPAKLAEGYGMWRVNG